MNILPIDKTKLPYRFTVRLNERSLTFVARYNVQADLYTLDVYEGDRVIAVGRPLLFGRDALFGVTDPAVQTVGIFPWSTRVDTGDEVVTTQNFMVDVFPWIVPRVR